MTGLGVVNTTGVGGKGGVEDLSVSLHGEGKRLKQEEDGPKPTRTEHDVGEEPEGGGGVPLDVDDTYVNLAV